MTDGESRNEIKREEPIPSKIWTSLESVVYWVAQVRAYPESQVKDKELTFRKPVGGMWHLLSSCLQWAAELSRGEFPWASWLPDQGQAQEELKQITRAFLLQALL